jgi:hypothetical protein
MKITGNDHSTRRQTNLLQDGIGGYFGSVGGSLAQVPCGIQRSLKTADVEASAIPLPNCSACIDLF